MNKMSILDSILESINQINWKSETYKSKAISLCKYIFSLYRDGDFNNYVNVSSKTIDEIVRTKKYTPIIKKQLVENNILIINDSYVVGSEKRKGEAKGYKFNSFLIERGESFYVVGNIGNIGNIVVGNIGNIENFGKYKDKINYYNQVNYSNKLENYINCSLLDNQTVTDYIFPILNRLKFTDEVDNYIENYTINENDILINNEIEDDFVYVSLENGKYRYGIEKAIKEANENDFDLIQYRGRKCYFDTKESFIKRKKMDMKLLFKQKVFDIRNDILFGSRNLVNNRFDYNLTNMKGILIEYLRLDGERLVELDIANAQFAILSNISNELDEDFVKLCQEGNLYEHLSERFDINRQEAKDMMFRVAFDKRKKDQDILRYIFPKTMNFIDNFKGENGYKRFSNLLQKTESNVMIDGLLNHLMSLGYDVLPIHDAMRVKESEAEEITKICNDYFLSINFNCKIRNKTNKETTQPTEIVAEEPEKQPKTDDFDWNEWEPVKNSRFEEINKDFGDGIEIEGIVESGGIDNNRNIDDFFNE